MTGWARKSRLALFDARAAGSGGPFGLWIPGYPGFWPDPIRFRTGRIGGLETADRRPDGRGARYQGSHPRVRHAASLGDPSGSRIPRYPRLRPGLVQFPFGGPVGAQSADRRPDGRETGRQRSRLYVRRATDLPSPSEPRMRRYPRFRSNPVPIAREVARWAGRRRPDGHETLWQRPCENARRATRQGNPPEPRFPRYPRFRASSVYLSVRRTAGAQNADRRPDGAAT